MKLFDYDSRMKHRNHLSPPVFPYPWASDWGEDQYGLWQAFTYKNVRHAFRWIQPGDFMMGSPEDEKGRLSGYEDLHQVTISKGFWLAETTVTQALWRVLMANNSDPSHFKGENRPVEQVSWQDTQDFIDKLNQLHSELKVRLPWEAEWEYACRAGIKTLFNFEGDLTLDKVNYRGTWQYEKDKWGDDAKKETTDVKTYPCNNWGLFEMHGNVWELCEDVWQESLGKEPVIDPIVTEGEVAAPRVIRGGSWYDYGRDMRSAIRIRHSPDSRDDDLGFRLALSHPAKPG